MAMVFEGGPDDIGQHSVMLALADNSDEGGVAWPGIELLARKSRHSERQVTRVLAALEAGGWLTIRRRVRGVRRRCSEYMLNLARLKSVSALRAVLDAAREDETMQIPPADIVSGGGRKRAAIKHTCNPRTDMVSGGEDELPNGVDELTLETPRTDTTLRELVLNQGDAFHNHHRTTIEPSSTTPVVPASGDVGEFVMVAGELVHFDPGVVMGPEFLECVLAERLAEREGERLAAVQAAAKLVMRECNWSADRRLEAAICAALALHCSKTHETPEQAAELAITNKRAFVEDRKFMRHGMNWVTFFRRGYWIDWQAWPLDQALINRARDARVGVGMQ